MKKSSPLSDVVSSQYSRWMYPQPILDIPAWLNDNWQWFDPSHAHRIFWPDNTYKPDMDILVAGCGTNQAAILAHTNPDARILAIDISQPSLDHHAFLKERHALANLELRLLPIEDVGKLSRDFDLIISTGVLHHMASPEAGMAALARCLRPEGVAAIMLYASFGRIGVEMMQSVFRDMGLGQSDTSVLMVRETLDALPSDHPLRSYLSLAPDLRYDAGLVDTFLHGRDRSYTLADCLDLVGSADLVFQGLFMKAPYYPSATTESVFHALVAKLPVDKQWAIMERVNHRNACHFFMACRKDRPADHYRIDFSSTEAAQYIPAFRYRCGVDGSEAVRPGWRMRLPPDQAAILAKVDGKRALAEIAAASGIANAPAMVESLWKLDFLDIGLSGTAACRQTPRKAEKA